MLAEEAKSASIATRLRGVVASGCRELHHALNWLMHCFKARNLPPARVPSAFRTNMRRHFWRYDP